MIKSLEARIEEAKAYGLNENDEYIQELTEKIYDYQDEIDGIREDSVDAAKNAVKDLVDYRIKMLKKDLDNEKDALKDKQTELKDFYSKQKEMLQDVYDEEKYLEEQSEKREAKKDIEIELKRLEFDDSAWAQKRKQELQEELAKADKDLLDFEKDHNLDKTKELLDDLYDRQEKQIESEIEALDERLNDPKALYNQALADIQNNIQISRFGNARYLIEFICLINSRCQFTHIGGDHLAGITHSFLEILHYLIASSCTQK